MQKWAEMLFTHFGVSGPLVLTASTYLKRELSCYHMEIDLKPALDSFQLEQRVLRDFEKYQNRDFFNSLSDLLPRKIIPSIVQLSSILPNEKVHQITKEQRDALCYLNQTFAINAQKAFLPIEEAIVTGLEELI